jgi:TolB-like protein/Flp pilus assembly protein TadD
MSFFNELKRRNVFKVAAAYIIVGWLIMQAGEVMAPALRLPDWINSALAFFLILGFPLAMFFAWAYEMTPEGLKKEKDVDRSQSISQHTGRNLNFTIIGLLVVALVYFVWESRFQSDDAIPVTSEADLAGKQANTKSNPDVSAETSTGQVPDKRSIAVLPFANRSNQQDDLYFTDGIHDDLLTQLAKIENLKVISRTSVMNYRDSDKKIPEIARELGVATILEGGVQRAGKRIRINAQLIDVNTDEHLWAETYDRQMTVENIFEIQSEITRQIVAAVRGELTSTESEALAQLPTQSLKAYEAYMHAKVAINRSTYSPEKYLLAQEWAEKAVAIDPGFTGAWTILVEANGHAVWMGNDDSAERVEATTNALQQAMAGAPDSAEAQEAFGEYQYRIKGDYQTALQAFKKASDQQPGNSRLMYKIASTLRRIGEFDDSIAAFEKALQLDPANVSAVSDYLLTLWLNGDYEKAIPLAEQAIRQFPNDGVLKSHLGFMYIDGRGELDKAHSLLNEMTPTPGFEYVSLATTFYLLERDYDQALATWDIPEVIEFSDYRGGPFGWRGRALGEIYYLLGETEKADKVLREFISTENAKKLPVARNHAYQLSNLALAYAMLGDSSTAMETMDQAITISESVGDAMANGGIHGTRARMLAIVGQREQALVEIERLLDTPASYLSRWMLTLDPRWDFMRDDERLDDLIRPIALKESENESL